MDEEPKESMDKNCPLSSKEWIIVLNSEINTLKYPDFLPLMNVFLIVMIAYITIMVNASLDYNRCIASNLSNSNCKLPASLTFLFVNLYPSVAMALAVLIAIGFINFLIGYFKADRRIKACKIIRESIIRGETDSNNIRKKWEKINMKNWNIKKYLSLIVLFIALLFVALLIFNYQWLTSNYQWLISNIIEIAVAAGTLFLAYIAYRQMQDSNEKIHTSNLKDMLRLWQQNLSSNKVAPAEETFTFGRLDSYAPSSLSDIENHALFEDIFHHFPYLRDFWNEFKTLSITYSLERQRLIDKIQEHIKQKFKERNFDLGSETGKGFSLSVYRETICIAKGKSSSYDYFTERISVKNVIKTRLIYGYMGTGNGYILAELESEEMEGIKNIHKEMIKECKELYLDDIKKIIELENKTRVCHNKLESMLDKISYCMVFPQMDCKFVK
ncbi:Uncharacterised protein [uncultured archaeon]|nr:Uncharacterised protein [uncultured archaeon]